jgi:hypothetical protein
MRVKPNRKFLRYHIRADAVQASVMNLNRTRLKPPPSSFFDLQKGSPLLITRRKKAGPNYS